MTSSTAIDDGAVGAMLSGGAIRVSANPTPPPTATEAAASAPTAKRKPAARKPAAAKTAAAAKKKPKKPAAAKRPAAKRATSREEPVAEPVIAEPVPVAEPQPDPAAADAAEHVDVDMAGEEDYDADVLGGELPDVTDGSPDFDEDEYEHDEVDEDGEADELDSSEGSAQPITFPASAPAAPAVHAARAGTLFIPDATTEVRQRTPFTPPVPGRAGAAAEPSPWALLEDDQRASEPPAAPEAPKRQKRSLGLPLSPRITRGRVLAFGAFALIGIGLIGGTPSKPSASSASTPAPDKPVATSTPSAAATPIPAPTATPTATPARRSSATRKPSTSKRKRRSSAPTRSRTRVQTRTVYVPVPAPTSAAPAAPRTTAPAPVTPRSAPAPSAGPSGFSSEFRP
jgi:hypothetical protein